MLKTEAQVNRIIDNAPQQEGPLMPGPPEGRLIRYMLMGLILAFFLMPVLSVYLFDCNFSFSPKKLASALILFFR